MVFALNHDKSLQIYFLSVKRQAKNDFPKDVERTVVTMYMYMYYKSALLTKYYFRIGIMHLARHRNRELLSQIVTVNQYILRYFADA